MASFRGYKAFFDRSLQAHMAYGSSLLLTLAAQAVGFAITLMVWRYAFRGGSAGAGFFAYLTLAFILNYSHNIFLERTVGQRIRDGLIATDLLKPVDFQFFYLLQAFSDVIFQAVIALIVFAVGLAVLGTQILPASWPAALWFLLSFSLAVLINYGICFLFVQGIFMTNSNYGVFVSRLALHHTFSGVFAPLTVFPGPLRAIAEVLPFHHVVHTPAAIYLGWIQGPAIPGALLAQALWAAGLLLAGRLAFRSILSRLAIQGG